MMFKHHVLVYPAVLCRWLRTQFSRHVLRLGYTIHVSDVDLAYAPYGELGSCPA